MIWGALIWGGLLALAGLAASMALTGVATAQQEPAVEPARQLSTNPTPVRAHTQPEIVVHPDDPDTLVVVESSFLEGTCHVHVSRDGGSTWVQREARPQPDEPRSCARPTFGAMLDLAFGADGTLYFGGAVGEDMGRGVTSPYVARSEDIATVGRSS